MPSTSSRGLTVPVDLDSAILGGGGQLASRKAIFCPSSLIVAACGASIRVYSALGSGELLFQMEGHTDEVTDLYLSDASSSSSSRLFSCSKDGFIRQWSLDSGTCVGSWELPGGRPAESMVVVGDTAYVSFFWRGEDAGRILAFDLAAGRANEVRIKLSTPRPVVCSSSSSGSSSYGSASSSGSGLGREHAYRIVATHDRHTILLWDVGREGLGRKRALRLHHTKAFTCVAVSPDGSRVAAGDVTGRILIWHDLKQGMEAAAADNNNNNNDANDANNNNSNSNSNSNGTMDDDVQEDAEGFVEYTEPPAASVHWHAHAVGCLSFSVDGRYLLSGGEEAVLVLWDVKTSGRAYLPRLGGPLTGIAPSPEDPAKYCLRQSDNTLRVVNIASMMIECSIHGVRPAPRAGCGAPICFEGRHGCAVVVGDHSVLQFFDVSRDVHVDRLQLSRRNIVSMSGEEDHGVVVEAVAFDDTAGLLVSVETSGDNQLLKFWDRSPDDQQQYGIPYRLNTLAENPHRTASGNHAVTGVAVATARAGKAGKANRRAASLVATCSASGDFALWETHREAAEVRSAVTWRKMAVIPGHHGDPLTAVAFSSDGSLVAVAGDRGALSLWDTASCAFVGELPPAFDVVAVDTAVDDASDPSGPSSSNSRATTAVFFLPESPLAVYVCASGIAVYDVLSLSIVWSAEIVGICSVGNDPASNHWAIVTAANHVLLFEGDSNRPKMGWSIRQRQTSAPKPPTLNPATSGGARAAKTAKTAQTAKAGKTRSAVPEIAFVPRGTTTYNAALPTSVPGCSPLVVFSPDREFMSVTRDPGMGPRTRAASDLYLSGGIHGDQGRETSEYRAIFGSAPRSIRVVYETENETENENENGWNGKEPAAGRGTFPTGLVLGGTVSDLAVTYLEALLE